MKKSFVRLVTCLLLVAMMVGLMPVISFAAANDHVHQTFTLIESNAASCNKGAYKRYKCNDCDYTYEQVTSPSLHESKDGYVFDEYSGDYTVMKCNTCGGAKYKFLTNCAWAAENGGAHNPMPETVFRASCKALDHTQAAGASVTEYTITKCSSCEQYLGGVSTASIPVVHNWETEDFVVSVKPTISKTGVKYKRCKDCGFTLTEVVPVKENTLKPGKVSKLTPVYNGYTSDKEIAGYLPSGSPVLIWAATSDGKFYRIDETEEYWISTSGVSVGKFGEGGFDDLVSDDHTTHTLERFYVKEATCETPEYTTQQCRECRYKYVLTRDPDVYKVYTHKDKDKNIWKKLDDPDITIPWRVDGWKVENDSEWVWDKQPTDSTFGRIKRTCSVCGKTEFYGEEEYKADLKAGRNPIKVVVKTEFAAANKKAVITGGEMVPVYGSYTSDKKQIGYGAKGCEVEILGYSMDKKMVQVVNNTGSTDEFWLKASDITVDGKPGAASIYNGARWFGTVKTGLNLAIRVNPTVVSQELSTLKSGSTVAVYEDKVGSESTPQHWAKISATEDKWVSNGVVAMGDKTGYMDLLPVLIGAPTGSDKYVAPTLKLPAAMAKGDVTSSIPLNIRKSASVSSEKLDAFQAKPLGKDIYIYDTKTVDGVEWGLVKRVMPAIGTTPIVAWGKQITKADLENENCKIEDGWISLNYFTITEKFGKPASATVSTPAKDTIIASGVVTSSIPLNVRKEPEVSVLNKLGSLPTGTKLDFYELGDANGMSWGRIDYKGEKAWVCLTYVQMNSSSSSSGSDLSAVPNATVANCATAVNVRSSADISGNLVGTIPLGTRIAVVELANGWGRVASKGWVYLNYVNFDSGAYDKLVNGTTESSDSSGSSSDGTISTFTKVTIPAKVDAAVDVLDKPDGTKVVLSLKPGDPFNLVDCSIVGNKLWYKISQGNVTGWLKDSTNLKIQEMSGIITSNGVNIYAEPSIDADVVGILGKGSSYQIAAGSANHHTEGIYAWAKLKGTNSWIMLHGTSQDTVMNSSLAPAYSKAPAITGSVLKDDVELYKDHDTSVPLVTLKKDTVISITDWYCDDSGKTWGKMTQGQYTGWIILNADNVEQNVIAGTVSAEIVNLYDKATASADHLQLQLKKGEKVTVTERILVGNTVWGRMVAAKDTQKRQLWGNLAGITLAGQTAPTNTSTDAPAATTAPETPSAPTGTIGYIANTETVNVRAKAGARNDLVTTLKKGTQVKVYETTTVDGALWGRIDQGWVAMMYVDLSSMGSTSGTTISGGTTTGGVSILTAVPAGAVAVGFTNTNEVKVRTGAGMGYPVTASLKKNASVVIYEQLLSGGMIWGRIGADQWICTSYVTLTGIGSTGSGTAGTIARCFFTANVRSQAGVGNALVGKVMVNSRVEIYETTTYSGELWGRTAIGWIQMDYVLTGDIPVL